MSVGEVPTKKRQQLDEPIDAPKKKKQKKSKSENADVTTSKEEVVVDNSGEKKKKKKKDKKTEEEVSTTAPETVAEEEGEKKKKKKKNKNVEEEKEKVAEVATAPVTENKLAKLDSKKWYADNNCVIEDVPCPRPCLEFEEAGFPEALVQYLKNKPGFVKPSLIQSTSWPVMMKGNDVFGIAKTGSGKTLAFTLPFIAKSEMGIFKTHKVGNQPRMVCVAPTKELAMQIAEVTEEFGNSKCVKGNYPTVCVIGGVPKGEQARKIRATGCDICVATPGRLLDVVENDGILDLSKTQWLVLDEADRMLDMGFIDNMRSLARLCPENQRQTLLFSATWPMEVNRLARSLIKKDGVVATITCGKKGANDSVENDGDKLSLNDAITQDVKVVTRNQKWDMLMELLNKNRGKKIIIFGLFKKEVANLENWLNQSGHKCVALQGDMVQAKRTQAIQDYKANKVRLLVATDVAGRGLDIPDIDIVINHTFPLTIEDFVHRCGRTGRAGKKGHAVTFYNPDGDMEEKKHCWDLMRLLQDAKQPVPEALRVVESNTFTATKKKAHSIYGNHFKSEEEMAKLQSKKVVMTFEDSDSD